MTDQTLLEIAQSTADMYYTAALSLAWQVGQELHMNYCTFDDPCDYDLEDDELLDLLYQVGGKHATSWYAGTLVSMKTIRTLWRANAVLMDWMDIAKSSDLTYDSMPSPKIIFS